MDVLLLRFEAPLMSFGSSCTIDNRIRTADHPTLSMVTGLLANALGYDYRDFERLEELQEGLRFAVRRDRGGKIHVDYQIMDLGQEYLSDRYAWTTWGFPQLRRGGSQTDPHQRYKEYLEDSCFTLALTSNLDHELLANALRSPARPLFLGRKCCPPSSPILLGASKATTLRDAVLEAPRPAEVANPKIWWPEGDSQPSIRAKRVHMVDQRDWRNQVHVGLRVVFEEVLDA